MRFYVRVTIPNEEGNEAIAQGKMGETMGAFVQKWKPEAAYFYITEGLRGATFFLNMDDASQMPGLVEPLFGSLNAEVEIVPAMNFDDLKKGLSALAK